jgi:hypothetical protein
VAVLTRGSGREIGALVETQRAVLFLQFFSSIEFAKIPVKGAQRKMAGFASDFEDQTVGETQRRTATVVLQRGRDRIGVLDDEISVMQQHLDRSRYFRVSEFIYGGKNPGRLNEHQMGYPSAFADKRFRRCDLLLVVARDETNQNVRVNGAHA